MNLLAFDTSSQVLSVALKKGNENLSETKIVGFLQHAEKLLPMIDEMLKAKKMTINDIDRFLIGRGPGSFTGGRIGFATLKGFLAARKVPCLGALSLDMIAENADLPEGSRLCVALDARREKLYTQFLRRRRNRWKSEGKAKVLSAAELADKFPGEIYLTGDAVIRYGDYFLKAAGKKKIHFLPESAWYPRASVLIRWFETKNEKLLKLEKPKDFIPFYFRLCEPEEKRKEKKHAAYC
jgi:tRNA threonylcarbamoyladenosine biosynthesis protein TsaB